MNEFQDNFYGHYTIEPNRIPARAIIFLPALQVKSQTLEYIA